MMLPLAGFCTPPSAGGWGWVLCHLTRAGRAQPHAPAVGQGAPHAAAAACQARCCPALSAADKLLGCSWAARDEPSTSCSRSAATVMAMPCQGAPSARLPQASAMAKPRTCAPRGWLGKRALGMQECGRADGRRG